VGFARSLLAFELPDGRLKLIDGHLRRDLDPEMQVEVEVPDVTEEEARTLLLSIDPLAALARTQEQLHQRLMEPAPPVPEEVRAAWRQAAQAAIPPEPEPLAGLDTVLENWFVLVTCRDEWHQLEVLGRLQAEGLTCKAVLS
jgi:hypothetical protein